MKKFGFGLMLTAAMSLGLPAVAADAPPGAIENVDYIGTLADTDGAVAINFLEYRSGHHSWGWRKGRSDTRNVMMVSGTFGLKSYDISIPSAPILLDEIDETEFRLPSDPETYSRAFWENEDMDVDQDRKLVIMARDPHAYDGSTSSPSAVAGVYIVDAADPENLDLKTFEELPVGHTSTCINDCDFLWTGGPASNTEQAQIWPAGRPIFATDLPRPRQHHHLAGCDRHRAFRRRHRLCPRRPGGRPRHRLGLRARRRPRVPHRGQAMGPTRGPTALGDPDESRTVRRGWHRGVGGAVRLHPQLGPPGRQRQHSGCRAIRVPIERTHPCDGGGVRVTDL